MDGAERASIWLAKLISYIFSAPLFALYSVVLIALQGGDVFHPLHACTAILICFVYLTVLPLLPIIVGSIFGRVDLFVSEREKRARFFLLALLSYTLGILTSQLLGCRGLLIIHASYFIVTLAMMLTTLRTKASVHVAGVMGPATYTVYLLGPSSIWLYLISIPVAWARIKLGAHTITEVALGGGIAVAATILTCYAINHV